MSSPAFGVVPVHVGQPEAGSQQERLLAQRQSRTRERPPRVPAGLAWQQHGVQPRWLGMETSDCAVAVEPSIFHNRGAAELDRFLAGARWRGELALVVAVIGDVTDDSPRHPLSRFDASVDLSRTFTSVSGRFLPAGTRPEIAPNLDPADRDLAIRLLTRPADAPWWGLHLSGAVLEHGDWSGSETREAEGELHPILVDVLGDPVVAAWTPPSGDQRWYVIPDATDWDNVLGWLVHRALPEYVPAALRRARSPHFVDSDLQTADELAARQALTELESRYAEEKLRLEADLRRAESTAEPVRYGLLYGSGAELVAAVAAVLTAAGLTVVNLDTEFRRHEVGRPVGLRRTTAASDRSQGRQRPGPGVARRPPATAPRHLASAAPGRAGDRRRPRRESPAQAAPVRTHGARVYSRPEFVDVLTVPVISTVELFNSWRTSDWAAIRTAVLGAEPPNDRTPAHRTDVPDASRAGRALATSAAVVAGSPHPLGLASSAWPWAAPILQRISRQDRRWIGRNPTGTALGSRAAAGSVRLPGVGRERSRHGRRNAEAGRLLRRQTAVERFMG